MPKTKKVPQIATYVFFDIETTGLPLQERNQTKIIEYSFIATLRKDLEATPYGEIPAAVGNITSFLNPERTVCRVVTQMTGLSRKKLSKEPTFGDKVQSIKSFLEALPPPVCLVSHNGNNFDFRILLAECNDVSANMPANLYCVDSLLGFRGLLMGTGINYSNLEGPQLSIADLIIPETSVGNLKMPQSSTENVEMPQSSVGNIEIIPSTVSTAPVAIEIQNHQDTIPLGEVTMDDIIIGTEEEVVEEITIDGTCLASDTDIENQEPTADSIVTNTRHAEMAKDANKKPCPTQGNQDRECFKLTTIYKRLLNREPENAHRAEADCLMLMHCVVALKKDFLPWADKNCQLLTKIKPLKRGQSYWRGRYRAFR